MTSQRGERDYDVCLSFAGEQRDYVERVAASLKNAGIRVFYDDYEKVALWGKDLYEHLDYIYGKSAEYCILFASEEYAKKVWTNHERRSAQARALTAHAEYVLPVRFDDTEIPGIRTTIGYLNAQSIEPVRLAEMIAEKLGPRMRRNFFPPNPDLLFEALEITDEQDREDALAVAYSFMGVLQRMTLEERKLVVCLFCSYCPSELPDNVHQRLDLVHRVMGWPPQQIIDTLRGIKSLGFVYEVRQDDESHDDSVLVCQWNDMAVDSGLTDFAMTNSTWLAAAMVELAVGHFCEACADRFIEALDFSHLSSATTESHG
ncbi:toll/interleukin-1 receptor domain-containing protein [Streptomyces bungoensis]|uniref:toll/interleukin-1 receptor domain-containing protein n=1 Tax=Streptomyces bungoensis TaxID=285568 RepID=UPI00343233B6